MSATRRGLRWALTLAGAVLPGCTTTPVAELAKPPALDLPGQATCKVQKSQLRPLVVEWPSADRAELEARMRQGPVVVRYDRCEMAVLPRCRAKAGRYQYVGVTRKTDHLAILNEDQLWANMPMGALGLEAALARAGQLDVAMTIVGQYELGLAQLTEDDLEGHCDGATHVLASLTVGAFELYTSTRGRVGGGAKVAGIGAGAGSRAERETITADGQVRACEAARSDDDVPPIDCGALIRVEALPLGEPRERIPECPAGSHWDGQQCVREQVVTKVSCPPGTHLEANGCVPGPADSAPSDADGAPGASEADGADAPATSAGGRTCPSEMVHVPAGSFALSADASEPGTLAEVGELCIDRTEVTAGDYLACVSAGHCERRAKKEGCWVVELTDPRTNYYVSVPSTADNPDFHGHPINCVTWNEANAYCAWRGKRLPTEAEWEWAARSGPLGRRYTWGDALPKSQACWQRARKGTCAAASRPGDRTAHGVLDMAGNVTEWTASFSRSFAITRGGSFYDRDPAAMLVATRPLLQKTVPRPQQGFRCAR